MPIPIVERNIAIATVTNFIKSRWTPINPSEKQLRWFTAPLLANPISTDEIITYAECEINTVHILIDIQDND